MNDNKAILGFSISRINTEQFAIIKEAYTEGNEINLITNLRFGIHQEDRIIAVQVQCQFEQDKGPFLFIQTGSFFEIERNSWDEYISKESITFSKPFISHLSLLAIGITRGILHSKTEHTVFNIHLLPIMNLNDLIKEDVIFNL